MTQRVTTVLERRLAEVLSDFKEIRAAYLFGSHAVGGQGSESDIDIGLVLRPGTDRTLKLDVLADLTRSGFEHVDIVLLNDADPVLRFEVVRPNRLIFARPDFDHPSYFSLALRMHEDEFYLLRWQRAALKERLQRAET
jgi:predicted nucleotidyltransferase